MVWEVVLGFAVLVAASYVGTTMALRGFFGRDYYDQSAALPPDGDAGPGGDGDERVGRGESERERPGREEGVEKRSEAGEDWDEE